MLRTHGPQPILSRLPLLLAAALLVAAGSAAGAEPTRPKEDVLFATYAEHRDHLAGNSFGLPLVLESFERDHRVHVEVYGIFAFPFGQVVDVLQVPANWCDIVSLPPNVKACTYLEQPGAWQLTFYLGRKTYQPPEDARRVTYLYRTVERRPGYLDITLSAAAGPFGTRDHQMRFEALPLDGAKTYVHVGYTYRDSYLLRLAGKSYFSTLGRGKAGFTVTGTDPDGNPVLIGGPRGALERNAVRYYFAIEAYMKTLRFPEESRFVKRINEWYDLTGRFKRQLFDLEKRDYLAAKTAERAHQTELQRRIVPGNP